MKIEYHPNSTAVWMHFQYLILILNMRGPSCPGLTRSTSWLLMPWLLVLPLPFSVCNFTSNLFQMNCLCLHFTNKCGLLSGCSSHNVQRSPQPLRSPSPMPPVLFLQSLCPQVLCSQSPMFPSLFEFQSRCSPKHISQSLCSPNMFTNPYVLACSPARMVPNICPMFTVSIILRGFFSNPYVPHAKDVI